VVFRPLPQATPISKENQIPYTPFHPIAISREVVDCFTFQNSTTQAFAEVPWLGMHFTVDRTRLDESQLVADHLTRPQYAGALPKIPRTVETS
jgi:hypothetical protein